MSISSAGLGADEEGHMTMTGLNWQEDYSNTNNNSMQLWWTKTHLKTHHTLKNLKADRLQQQTTSVSIPFSQEQESEASVNTDSTFYCGKFDVYIVRSVSVTYKQRMSGSGNEFGINFRLNEINNSYHDTKEHHSFIHSFVRPSVCLFLCSFIFSNHYSVSWCYLLGPLGVRW